MFSGSTYRPKSKFSATSSPGHCGKWPRYSTLLEISMNSSAISTGFIGKPSRGNALISGGCRSLKGVPATYNCPYFLSFLRDIFEFLKL